MSQTTEVKPACLLSPGFNQVAQSEIGRVAQFCIGDNIATTKFGNTLTLSGSPEFQRLAVETAALKNPSIRFADPALEAYRAKFSAQQKPVDRFRIVPDLSHLTPNQIAKGVAHVITNTLDHGRPPEHVIRAECCRRHFFDPGTGISLTHA